MLKASLISQHIRLMELAPCPIRQLSWRVTCCAPLHSGINGRLLLGSKGQIPRPTLDKRNQYVIVSCLFAFLNSRYYQSVALHVNLFQNCFTIHKTIHYSDCIVT